MWRDEALCATGEHDPDMWFPEGGDWRPALQARAICQFCPVRMQCMAEAMSMPPRECMGIWGGLGMNARLRIVKARNRRRKAANNDSKGKAA